MNLDAEEISAAIDDAIARRLHADPPEAHEEEAMKSHVVSQAEDDGFREVWDALLDTYDADSVLKALVPHKDDPLIAAVVAHTCEIFGRRLLDYFTANEIVSAAAHYILTVPWWKSGIHDGGWLFSAVYSHFYGQGDSVDDEEQFQLVIALLDRIPADNEFALFVVGDGPLSEASAVFYDQIQELAETHPSVREAWFQNLTDGDREFRAAASAANKGRSGDPIAVCVELSPDVTYGVVLTRLSARDNYLLDDLLRHTGHCEWEQITGGSGGGTQWSQVEDGRGVLRFSGEAPPGTTHAIINHNGVAHEVPVKDGYFLFVDWNSDAPSDPLLERFE